MRKVQQPGAESPWGRRITAWGGKKIQQCHKYFLKYSSLHLLPKDLRFEHGGAKLAYCPGHHSTLLRPWHVAQNRGSRNYTYRFTFFPSNFCAPRQSGAHGMCHACHTLDTPLTITLIPNCLRGNAAQTNLWSHNMCLRPAILSSIHYPTSMHDGWIMISGVQPRAVILGFAISISSFAGKFLKLENRLSSLKTGTAMAVPDE